MGPHHLPVIVQVDETDLLAAIRRASSDPELTLEEAPTPINLRATVISVRLRSAVAALNTSGVLRLCDAVATAARQVTIMRYLHAVGYPAAEVLLTGSPDDPLGGAWLMTELIPGPQSSARRADHWPNPVRSLLTLWRRPALLANLNARLHAVEPEPLRHELSASAVGLDWYRFLWDRARMVRGPNAEQVLDWLEQHRPTDSKLVISHGDLHHDNVVDGRDGLRVIDWEIAGLAPPARDVACSMVAMLTTYCRAPRLVRPLTAALGRAMSRRFLRLYRSWSPAELPDAELAWHRTLYSLNRLYWASLADEERDPEDPARREEREIHRHELPIHTGIIREITGVDVRAELR